MENSSLISVTKDKSIITFMFNDADKILFDFKTGKFIEPKNKKLRSVLEDIDNLKKFHTNIYFRACSDFYYRLKYYEDEDNVCSLLEPTLSYPELIDFNIGLFPLINSMVHCGYKTFPKNYVSYCYKNKFKFTDISFEKFFASQVLKIYPKQYRDILYELYCKDNIRCYHLRQIAQAPLSVVASAVKSLKISLKKFDIYNLAERVTLLIVVATKYPDWYVIDTNRSLDYNMKLYGQAKEERVNRLLPEKLQVLSPLNKKPLDELYQIIVPTDLIDLQNEGRQQNNCVGTNYNDSIVEGKDLIYFIRKKNSPDKSYITCRFSVRANMTEEARGFNNTNIDNDTWELIFNKVDTMIKEILRPGG